MCIFIVHYSRIPKNSYPLLTDEQTEGGDNKEQPRKCTAFY